MKVYSFGAEKAPVILLLPGTCCHWKVNFGKVIPMLTDTFKCMIGRHRNFELVKRTDMHLWYGIASSTEKKLAKHVKAWQDKGYAFTYKVFPNMGHGTLAGEHPQEFSKEVQAAHQCSLQKEKL